MPFTCPVCSKEFEQKSNLIRHTNKHEGKMFVCDICGKKFNDQSNLKKHIKGVHENKAEHRCDLCDAMFKQKTHLQAHMVTHSDQKEFICGVCGKKFSRSGVLEIHMRIHSDKKQYKCEICSEEFNHKVGLEYHMGKHTGVAAFTCEVCQRKFDRKGNFERHKLIHSKEKSVVCRVCSKAFNHKLLLDGHMLKYHPVIQQEDGQLQFSDLRYKLRNPSEEAYKYGCDFCDKKFTMKGNLNRHKRQHHAVEAQEEFRCTICSNTYLNKRFLDMHLKTDHTELQEYLIAGLNGQDMNHDTPLKKKKIMVEPNQDSTELSTCAIVSSANTSAIDLVYSSVNMEQFMKNDQTNS